MILKKLELPLIYVFKGMILFYRLTIAGLIPTCCRYYPSCSEYALIALRKHGLRGVILVIVRLLRCHPWGGGYYDPVPDEFSLNKCFRGKKSKN